MTRLESKQYPRVLSIAGSDSGGGAGIQADIKTISANGCYAATVITALTAQNTMGVKAIHPVPVDFVAAQIQAVLEDIGADAVKIGMLYSSELIRVVAEQLQKFQIRHIILDPVMVAQSGDSLLQCEAIEAMKKHLIPITELITPNLPEASVLLGKELLSEWDIEEALAKLCHLGCPNVLIKGGHMDSPRESRDWLYLGKEQRTIVLSGKRIDTENNHGTGCTLSSAIATFIARGEDLPTAVRLAKDYIQASLQSATGWKLGNGHGPVHHFHQFFP